MPESSDEIQVSKIEVVFVVGIIGCMLFATWELSHLMVDKWLKAWVSQNKFTNKRIILYGIAFLMAITSVVVTTWFSPKFGRFGSTVNRAFLWYGTLLLISTLGILVFDCLPEVFAGFIGAGIFIMAIYVLQRRFFTRERLATISLSRGKCPGCGTTLPGEAFFCPHCRREVGRTCPTCQGFTRVLDRHCSKCGNSLA
jgi:hypothetical protein